MTLSAIFIHASINESELVFIGISSPILLDCRWPFFHAHHKSSILCPYLKPSAHNGIFSSVVLILLFARLCQESLQKFWRLDLLLLASFQTAILLIAASFSLWVRNFEEFIILSFLASGSIVAGGICLNCRRILPMLPAILLPLITLSLLLLGLPKSFSLGEAIVCSTILSNSLIVCLFLLFDYRSNRLLAPTVFMVKVSATLVLGCFLSITLSFLLSRAGILFRFSMLAVLSTIIFCLLMFKSRRLFTGATIQKVFSVNHLTIVIQWMGYLLIVFGVSALYLCLIKMPTKFQSHLARKFYHLMAMVMFIPILHKDSVFLKFALVVAACIFAYIEAIRLLCPKTVVGKILSTLLERFRNDADQGNAILSHLWLLLGCALPILITENQRTPVAWTKSVSGIMSLGMFDSVAALTGIYFGGPTWPGSSKKTLIGSFLGLIIFISGQVGLLRYYFPRKDIPWVCFMVQGVYCMLWEAHGAINDNMSLPIVSCIIVSNLISL